MTFPDELLAFCCLLSEPHSLLSKWKKYIERRTFQRFPLKLSPFWWPWRNKIHVTRFKLSILCRPWKFSFAKDYFEKYLPKGTPFTIAQDICAHRRCTVFRYFMWNGFSKLDVKFQRAFGPERWSSNGIQPCVGGSQFGGKIWAWGAHKNGSTWIYPLSYTFFCWTAVFSHLMSHGCANNFPLSRLKS